MHSHHSHHHRQPAPIQPQGPVKHHYGSGKYTGGIVAIMTVCLVVNLVWWLMGVNHP